MDNKNLTPEGNEVTVEKKGFFKKLGSKVKGAAVKTKDFVVDHRGAIGAAAGVAAGVAGMVLLGNRHGSTSDPGTAETYAPEPEEPYENTEDFPQEEGTEI